MESRATRPAPEFRGFRSGLLAVALFAVLALTVSACGGGGSGGGSSEGKGFPGDTDYADSVIRPYYVNNGLVDAPVAPGTVLPATVSNQSLLTANVPNQGEPGTCATVSFAQLVYGADVAQKAANPLLENVQYSYLFARFFQSDGQGGEKGWPEDSGSYAYTNFQALTTPSYRTTYANGLLPIDGEKTVEHATGVFFPFADSPNLTDPINAPGTMGPPLLNSFWNKIDLWKDLNSGPTMLAITIRRAAFSPSSLDVKAIVAAGHLMWFGIDTQDEKNQWSPGSSFLRTGVLKLPYTQPKNPKPEGHAMVIVGYDDAGYDKYPGDGAFKIRNSWSDDFGDKGYWYLPYSIVDGVAGNPENNDYPLFYSENFVYISALAHN